MMYFNKLMSMVEAVREEGKRPVAWTMHPRDAMEIERTADPRRGNVTKFDGDLKVFGLPVTQTKARVPGDIELVSD